MTQKDKYCEFIARGVRYAQKENHGVFFPESTIVVVDYLSDLANYDSILGWNIFVSISHSSYSLRLAIPSENEKERKLLKSFDEFLDFNSID